LCADKSGGVTTADTGRTRNLSRSGSVNDRADLHSPEASALSQSHLRPFDNFVGTRIFYPLLVDKLVPSCTQVVDGGLHASRASAGNVLMPARCSD